MLMELYFPPFFFLFFGSLPLTISYSSLSFMKHHVNIWSEWMSAAALSASILHTSAHYTAVRLNPGEIEAISICPFPRLVSIIELSWTIAACSTCTGGGEVRRTGLHSVKMWSQVTAFCVHACACFLFVPVCLCLHMLVSLFNPPKPPPPPPPLPRSRWVWSTCIMTLWWSAKGCGANRGRDTAGYPAPLVQPGCEEIVLFWSSPAMLSLRILSTSGVMISRVYPPTPPSLAANVATNMYNLLFRVLNPVTVYLCGSLGSTCSYSEGYIFFSPPFSSSIKTNPASLISFLLAPATTGPQWPFLAGCVCVCLSVCL